MGKTKASTKKGGKGLTEAKSKLVEYFKDTKSLIMPAFLFLVLLVLVFVTYQITFLDKIYPGVYLGDTNLTFLTRYQAQKLVQDNFNQRVNTILQFTSQDKSFNIDLSTSSAILSQDALDKTLRVGHEGTYLERFQDQLQALIFKKVIIPEINFNIDEQVEKISVQVLNPPKDASLSVEGIDSLESTSAAKIKVTQSENGLGLDEDKLKNDVKDFLVFGIKPQALPIKSIEADITTEEAQTARVILENISQNPLTLKYQDQSWILDVKTLITLLDIGQKKDSLLAEEKILDYLDSIAIKINQPVSEGQFVFNPQTRKVTAFKASQEGRELNISETVSLINNAIENNSPKIVELPVSTIQPKIKTEEVNNLGIKELLGRGISHFAGSIPNRIYNINLTATKINGVLIAPGEIFSFNKTVGDISAETGFKQAYVIKSGRTVLDDGGGVCQDSTTLFRAVLNAGLPVIQRTAHAYRVGYYEQGFPPGLDATVFHPTVDFQFKNDTPYHILIQSYTEGLTLYVDLYGTSDGRVSTLTKPIVTNVTPAPPDLRQDDPTLPKGEVKQVDWAAKGATVTFKRTVKKDGKVIIDETFKSNYKSWQAVYLVGTKEN